MQTAQLIKRNLTYYWRVNLAVILGVAAAVAVLAGALLVGDSVRGSLRDLFLQKLGNTDHVITSPGFFREQLAADIQSNKQFSNGGFAVAAPLIAIKGTISHEATGRLSSDVRVYGVDERFWSFHGRENRELQNRESLISQNLLQELGGRAGDAILLRIEKPSEIPAESLHSKKEDLGRTLRLTLRAGLSSDELGEFSIQPQQSATNAVFVPLRLLQRELEQEGKANLILISETSRNQASSAAVSGRTELLAKILDESTQLADLGIKLRPLSEQGNISLEHDSKLISESLAETATRVSDGLSMRTAPVLSYLANFISSGDRAIPYSLVTALDEKSFAKLKSGDLNSVKVSPSTPDKQTSSSSSNFPIILNEWAAQDLDVRIGDAISLEYYLWHESGRLETQKAQFELAGIVPIAGLAADRDLVPEYPGITGSVHISDWDPPFPVDLGRIRKRDEEYWDEYRTTPKAFIPLEVGQRLWQSRFGKLTSMRIAPSDGMPLQQAIDNYQQQLKSSLNPRDLGLALIPVRQQGLEASRGATNFGEYFLYFSFFLVVSALLLTALFFKLGIEQRLREIGLLQAVGFPATRVRKLFLSEGVVLSLIGSLLGLVGALAYAGLMMHGLRTWWVDAVGTTALKLHISSISLLLGAIGGVIAALLCIVWTLRQLRRQSTRGLLSGAPLKIGDKNAGSRVRRSITVLHTANVLAVLGLLFLAAAALKLFGQVAGFFGGGTMLLAAFLCYQAAWLRRDAVSPINGQGFWQVSRLGFRNATYRPGRSVLCIALIASAAFIIVSVDAFRRREGRVNLDPKSGSGGFALLAESLLPVVHDPNSREGKEALNLTANDATSPLAGVVFARFRLRPGDDASCLNLYQPHDPRIIAPTEDFVRSNRFTFQNALTSSNEEKDNPWLLLDRRFDDGAVPVIADANSMTYVLHLKLGDEFILNRDSGPIRLRIVGSLADSVFQSELVMSERNFLRLFPEQEGYRFFLIDTAGSDQGAAISVLEDRLSDFGFDVATTAERLATFHRVENTYLSTFQMLGGLGLLLGTVGIAAVLLRNVLERRRELALLRAIGYRSSHFTLMVTAENGLLLCSGLLTGIICALLAIAPAFFQRGGRLLNISLGLLLLAVLVSGLTASLIATWAALRSPLLAALRAE